MLQRQSPACFSGRGAQAHPTPHGSAQASRPLLAGLSPHSAARRAPLCAAYEEALVLADDEDSWRERPQQRQWQGQQQQQQRRQQRQRGDAWPGAADARRGGRNGAAAQPRDGYGRYPVLPRELPAVVRVQEGNEDAVGSSVQGAAGALVKKLETEDLVRLVAVDEASVWRTITVLLAADNMLRANIGHMIVWQPVLINAKAADPPDVPQGAYVFYTTKLLAGDVVTDNSLLVGNSSDPSAVGPAIIARICTNAHTVVECMGSVANTLAVQSIVQARKGLLSHKRDCAVVLAPQIISSNKGDQPTVMLSRLVLLECEARNPGRLQIQASVVPN